jgi:hypothetical protein
VTRARELARTTGVVFPYADDSARTSALPSPVEGDMSSLAVDEQVYRSDGTNWVAVGGSGGGLQDTLLYMGA